MIDTSCMNGKTDRDLASGNQLFSISSYREILEKFCKVFDLKMSIRDIMHSKVYSSLIPIYVVKIFMVHSSEESKNQLWFTSQVGRYDISSSGLTIEDACKKYIEDFLLDEKKTISIYMPGGEDPNFPHDRLESANLNFPRSGLEALLMFLDMVDTDGKA